jgi:hypothetical protein
MPVTRVYVPIGRRELEQLSEQGFLVADATRPLAAFAVTDALAAGAPGLDVENLEYAAFSDAVKHADSVRTESTDRRVVAAADADPDWVTAGDGAPASAVGLVAPVPVSRIASFHVDENVGVAPGGSPGDDADELLWYDVTELEDVRSLLS